MGIRIEVRAWIVAAVSCAVLSPAAPAALNQPTFRARIDLVTVDATVVGNDGAPIAGLAPTDFDLTVDGRRRQVISAQFVAHPSPRAPLVRIREPHFTSNEDTSAPRHVVVAVDQTHISRLAGREALRAAAAFIDALDEADRVAVVGLSPPGSPDFTLDRVALSQRLAGLVGQADPLFQSQNLGLSEALEIADGSRSRLADAVLRECGRALGEYVNVARAVEDGAGRDACPEQIEQESRAIAQHAHVQARLALSAIDSLLATLAPLHGPKTVVLLSEGLVADPQRIDLLKLAAAAQAARVSIYVLQIEGPTFEAAQERVSPTLTRDRHVRSDGLSRLAGAARGAVLRLVGSDPRPFQRIARETAAYYLLAFEATEGDRDGRTHRIDVTVPRRRVDVRSRAAFALPALPSTPSPAHDLVALLRSASHATELPLRVATYVYLEPASAKLRVVVSAEAAVASGPALGAVMGFVLVDLRGVIAATASHESGDGRHAFSASVAPGPYVLRVAAIDHLGRQGSVERAFEAQAATGHAIRVSDLFLAPPQKHIRDPLIPFIDEVQGSQLLVYLELYASAGETLSDTAATLEVLEIGGRRVLSDKMEVTSHGTWAILRGRIPAAMLLPGRYTARVEIDAPNAAVATRAFTVPGRN